MSTRATYKINGQCFYIHHDGYLSGSADYFYNALTLKKGERYYSDLEADFFRCNLGASFIKSHSEVGGTEFRYTVKGDTIKAEQVVWNPNADESWKTVFNGKLIDFVNEYSHEIKEDPTLKFKEFSLSGYGKADIHNKISIGYVLESKLALKTIWDNNGNNSKGANYEQLIKEIDKIKSEFDI